MRLLLGIVVAVFYLLHQDVWFWNQAEPLLFGFLPVGLAYHACYTLAAAALMAILVRLAGPGDLGRQD